MLSLKSTHLGFVFCFLGFFPPLEKTIWKKVGNLEKREKVERGLLGLWILDFPKEKDEKGMILFLEHKIPELYDILPF